MYVIGEEEIEAVRRVIESRQLFRYRGGEGCETDRFEKAWSEKIGVEHTIAVTSGTAALICGMVGMGVGPGDEVIVPGYTFMASALAPLAVGAVPVIAEIDESLAIDPDDVKRKCTPRTKAVIPVDMLGLPCDMDAVMRVAEERDVRVLEDACQAVGGSCGGKRLGAIGHAGAFSFNQFKNITCGEGGALVTSDREIYERALIHHDGGCVFREHAAGMKVPFFAGWNFRTNEILSAIMNVQLGRLDGILEGLRKEKRTIVGELSDVSAFRLNPVNDAEGDCGSAVAMLFGSREEARAFAGRLKEEGVGTMLPIDTGRHVYSNWEPIMEKRGAHHPGRDAYRLAEMEYDYSKDMCPKTLSILERTACISTSLTRTEEETRRLVAAVRKAAGG